MLYPGLSQDKGGVLLSIRVKPRGRKNAVEGWREGALVVVVTAPPSEGAANAAVLEVLSEVLQCAKSTLRVVRGHKARDKQIQLTTLSLDEATQRLSQAVPMP